MGLLARVKSQPRSNLFKRCNGRETKELYPSPENLQLEARPFAIR